MILSEKSKAMIDQMREQTEQMRAPEEELPQNLEELETTQEDMRRKELDKMLNSEYFKPYRHSCQHQTTL